MSPSNLLHEHLISLGQVARRIPPYRGCKTNPSTIFRWLRDGVKLPNGTSLRLEGIRLAGRWLTSQEAVDRFLAEQNAACNPNAEPSVASPIRTAVKRRKASEEAAEELEKMSVAG